ncbi:hypothetical protein BpHYR1_017319, partial [Brachionus plicatilis]
MHQPDLDHSIHLTMYSGAFFETGVLSVVQDVKTRWHSTLAMIERIKYVTSAMIYPGFKYIEKKLNLDRKDTNLTKDLKFDFVTPELRKEQVNKINCLKKKLSFDSDSDTDNEDCEESLNIRKEIKNYLADEHNKDIL